jgi:hypothetical protein
MSSGGKGGRTVGKGRGRDAWRWVEEGRKMEQEGECGALMLKEV